MQSNLSLRVLYIFLSAITTLPSVPTTAQAIDLKVDFGVADLAASPGTTTNDVEFGFLPFDLPAENSTPSGDSAGRGSHQLPETRNFSGIEVSLGTTDQYGLTFVDINTLDVEIPDLLEEVVIGTGKDLVLTISNLPMGRYSMQTFHHFQTAFEQAQPIDIFLDSGNGEHLFVDNVIASRDYPNSWGPTSTSFEFIATGNDVVLRMTGERIDFPDLDPNPVYLNGFVLVSVPEPSGLALLAAGTLAIGIAVGRQRKLS